MNGLCFTAPRDTRLRPSTGKTKDGESVSGSINIPEVAHDTEENEYVVCFPLPSLGHE